MIATVIAVSIVGVPFAIGCSRIVLWVGDRWEAHRRSRLDRIRRARLGLRL